MEHEVPSIQILHHIEKVTLRVRESKGVRKHSIAEKRVRASEANKTSIVTPPEIFQWVEPQPTMGRTLREL